MNLNLKNLYMPRLCVSLVSEAWMFWWTVQCPYKWWSIIKLAVFGSSSDSSLPPLVGAGGGLVCESVDKADMLSAHFDGKVQGSSRSAIHLPSICQSHYLCLQVTGGEAAPAGSRFLWWHWPIGNVSSFFEDDSCGSGLSSCCGISAAPSF